MTPIGLDHTQYLGDTVVRIAAEKAGIIKPDAVAVLALQPADAAGELLRRAVEVDATVAREGLEFGVIERRIAVGGQFLALQGLGGVYDEIFLPLHGAHQAQNAVVALAAVEAFLGAGGASGAIDVDVVRAAFAARRVPGAPRGGALGPDHPARRRAQPVRADRDADRSRRGVPVPPAGGGRRRSCPTRTSRGCSTCSSPRSTRSSSPRSAAAARARRRRARRAGRADLRRRPGDRRAPPGRRHRGRGAAGRADRRPGAVRRRRAGHRLGRHRRRGPHPVAAPVG